MRLRVLTLGLLVATVVPAWAVAKPFPSTSSVRAAWLKEIDRRARLAPRQTFRNLSRAAWFTSVGDLERRFGFEVVEAKILRPRQDAPLLVVRTGRSPKAFARDVHSIQLTLDPKRPTGDDRTGWAYEGFYFEARDEHGVPFLAIFNYWRGPHAGGGQWASNPAYYPFAHGY